MICERLQHSRRHLYSRRKFRQRVCVVMRSMLSGILSLRNTDSLAVQTVQTVRRGAPHGNYLLSKKGESRNQKRSPKTNHAFKSQSAAFSFLLSYFSVQNLTSLPSRIILVVRTAYILPHIEQVCRSAGGVLSKYAFAFSGSIAYWNISSHSTR